MYFGRGMRDLLGSTQLNMEFFSDLDQFQIHFIEMCFKQAIESKMGLLNDVEKYNYHLFEEFKMRQFEDMYGIDEELFKKVA